MQSYLTRASSPIALPPPWLPTAITNCSKLGSRRKQVQKLLLHEVATSCDGRGCPDLCRHVHGGTQGSNVPQSNGITMTCQFLVCSEEATINALVSSAAFYRKVREHPNIVHGNQQQRTSRSFSHQAVTAPCRPTTSRTKSAARAPRAQTGPQATQQSSGIFVGAFKGQANSAFHVRHHNMYQHPHLVFPQSFYAETDSESGCAHGPGIVFSQMTMTHALQTNMHQIGKNIE